MCGWAVDQELNSTEFFVFIRSQGRLHENAGDGPVHDHNENPQGETIDILFIF